MTAARTAYTQIRAMLIDELSSQQQDVYRYAVNFENITARNVADDFDLSITHASTVLKELYTLGLLARKQIDGGREYEYETAE